MLSLVWLKKNGGMLMKNWWRKNEFTHKKDNNGECLFVKIKQDEMPIESVICPGINFLRVNFLRIIYEMMFVLMIWEMVLESELDCALTNAGKERSGGKVRTG